MNSKIYSTTFKNQDKISIATVFKKNQIKDIYN